MTQRTRAYLYALTTILFWSTVASAFKMTLHYLTTIELLFYSSAISTFILFIILIGQGKHTQLKQFKSSDYLFSLLAGFLNPFLYYLVLFKAYTLLPAQQAQPLNMIWGIVLVLISIPLLKQKLRIIDIFALLICLSGVVVISTGGDFSTLSLTSPFGVLLAVGSSFIWSFYWILNIKDSKDPIVRLFINFAAGTLFILPIYLLQFRIPPIQGILGAIYIGCFEMGISFFLWITALKLTDRTVNIAVLIYLVPFLSFIFIYLLVGEKILLSSIIGACLIVMGTFLNKYREFKKQ